jgi:hypothetical protein
MACRGTQDGSVVQEIYRRSSASIGFRYFAWVAWRNGGGHIENHGWYQIAPDQALVTDDYSSACEIADRHAKSKGLELSEWSRL